MPSWSVEVGGPVFDAGRERHLDDSELGPFYNVLLAGPDLDFEYVVTRIGDRPMTLNEIIDRGGRPDLARGLGDYYEVKYR